MSWIQKELVVPPKPRGFHVITYDILRQIPEIRRYKYGIAHFFIQHTSASLALNEGVDPDVRADLEAYFERAVPEDVDYFTHTHEGADDMPAHIKSVLIGHSLSIPIGNGRLALGSWQGIYLCEHRDRGRARRIVVTLHGQLINRDDA